MFKIRFFISAAIFAAITIMIPFFIHVEIKMYALQILVFFLGYLAPETITARMELKISVLIWLIGSCGAIVLYDYLKTIVAYDYVFLSDWKNFYPVAVLFFMGIHGYSRFISALIFKQLTRKS